MRHPSAHLTALPGAESPPQVFRVDTEERLTPPLNRVSSAHLRDLPRADPPPPVEIELAPPPATLMMNAALPGALMSSVHLRVLTREPGNTACTMLPSPHTRRKNRLVLAKSRRGSTGGVQKSALSPRRNANKSGRPASWRAAAAAVVASDDEA